MELPMKKTALALFITIVLLITATGCAGEGEPVADSCLTCHTDEDTLQAVASPEEKETSEATSGEG
jgi:hypothetical protein